MSKIRKYIIVDDDRFNNMVCKLTMQSTLGGLDIKTFVVPEEGLAFIQNECIKSAEPIILFLDINMPSFTGWEFMAQYEKLSEEVKKQIRIYILSSSVDQRDKDKAEGNKYIKGFISKPLQREMILSIAAV